jgi:copper(I)-binding protein
MVPVLLALLACSSPTSPPPDAAAQPADAAAAPAGEAVTGAVPQGDAARITVAEARVRAMPPGAAQSAAFLTLTAAAAPAALTGAASPAAASVELHTHTKVDGVMQMRQVPEIPLPAGQPVVLQPGGLHLMLIGLTGPLAEGASVPFTLRFGDGSSLDIEAPVVAVGGQHAGHGAHAGHGDHAAADAKPCDCGNAGCTCAHHGDAEGCTCGAEGAPEGGCTCGAGKGEGHGGHHAP